MGIRSEILLVLDETQKRKSLHVLDYTGGKYNTGDVPGK